MNDELNNELISAYLDDELEGAERDAVKSRLDKNMDDECLFNEFRQLGDLLRDLPREPAPAGMVDVVRRQLERQSLFLTTQTVKAFSTVARWSNRWLAGGLASALMLCFGSYYLFQQQGFHTEVAMTSHAPVENTYDVHLADTSSDYLAHSHSRGTSYFNVYDDSVVEFKNEAAKAPEDHFHLKLQSTPFAEMESHDFASTGLESLPANSLAIEEQSPPLVAGSLTDHSELMAGISFSASDLPPPPPVPAQLESSILERLNESPKLDRKLQAGELVRLLQESDGEVALVELSVVDVRFACGQVQLLLVQNDIAESQQQSSLNDVAENKPVQHAKIQPQEETEIRQSDGFKNEGLIEDNLYATQRSQATKSAAKKIKTADKQELIAFYIDAPTESVLNSLNQLESLDQVQKIHVGEAPHLSHDFYSVVPMDAENPLGESLPLMVNVFNRAYYGNGMYGGSGGPEDEALSLEEAEMQKGFRVDHLEITRDELLARNNGRQLRFLYSPVDNLEAMESSPQQQRAEEDNSLDLSLDKPVQDQKQRPNSSVATSPADAPEGETKVPAAAPATIGQTELEAVTASPQDNPADDGFDPQNLAYQVTVNLIPLQKSEEDSVPTLNNPAKPTPDPLTLGVNHADKDAGNENERVMERKSGDLETPVAPIPKLAAKQSPRRTRMVIVLTPVNAE